MGFLARNWLTVLVIVLVIMALAAFGGMVHQRSKQREALGVREPTELRTLNHDGCQYVVWQFRSPGDRAAAGGIVHKGNCPNHK